jgi:PAS domain S-box-containing protein
MRRQASDELRDTDERLAALDELLRADDCRENPAEVMATVIRVLGLHLTASRCAYAYVDAGGEQSAAIDDYTDDCESITARFRPAPLGARELATLRAGGTVVVSDVALELTTDEIAGALTAIEVKAFICCGLVRSGRVRALLTVQQNAPRDWTADEIVTTERIAERCWPIIEALVAEQTLRASREQLSAVVDASTESIMVLSPDGAILEINSAGARFAEASGAAALIGASFESLVAPEDAARFASAHRAACKGETGRLAHDVVGRNGTRRSVETVSTPIQAANGRTLHLAISRDATEIRRLEEEVRRAQKSEAVGKLAAGVAHDFNNLVAIIIGYCDLLDERSLPATEQELIDEVRRAAERGAATTRQMLAFTRNQAATPRVLNLNAIVIAMERMLRRLCGTGVALTCKLDDALAPVKLDAGEIEQVIVNLVVNACEAMPSGGTVFIETANDQWDAGRCRSQPDRVPGCYVTLAIGYSGAGMSPGEQIISNSLPAQESGLGLSVAQRIVARSGGVLEVHNEPRAGTTIRACFRSAPSIVERTGAPPQQARGTETVLLVESRDDIRKLLRLALVAQGYEVLAVADGGAALGAAEAYAARVDVVVAPVIVGVTSGAELVARLRSRWPELKALFVGAHAADAALGAQIRSVANCGFLHGPPAPLALASKIRELLDGVGRRLRLLLVDDEAPLVLLATRALEEQGYAVTACVSALDATAAFMRDPLSFDLVVTDLNMKGASGFQLAKQLRAFRPELPVIVMSGYVDDELAAQATALGVAALLDKPTDMGEFGRLVRCAAQRVAPG